MTALRKSEGVDIEVVKNHFGEKYMDALIHSSKKFIGKDWIGDFSSKLILTREGKLFADRIASELFI